MKNFIRSFFVFLLALFTYSFSAGEALAARTGNMAVSSVTVNQNEFQLWDQISVSANLENIGAAYDGRLYFMLARDPDGTSAITLGNKRVRRSHRFPRSYSLNATVRDPVTPGDYYLVARLDADSRYEDTDRSDNFASQPVTILPEVQHSEEYLNHDYTLDIRDTGSFGNGNHPDLDADYVRLENGFTFAYPGDRITLRFNANSHRWASSEDLKVFIHFGPDPNDYRMATKVGEYLIEGGIRRNNDVGVSYDFDIPYTTHPGEHYLYFWIDAENVEANEYDESNNGGAAFIHIVDPDGHYGLHNQTNESTDLDVSPALSTSTIEQGKPVDLQVVIRNEGHLPLPDNLRGEFAIAPHSNRYDGHRLGRNNYEIPALEVGEEYVFNFHHVFPWDDPTGNFFLNFKINYPEDITPYDNKYAFPISVVSHPANEGPGTPGYDHIAWLSTTGTHNPADADLRTQSARFKHSVYYARPGQEVELETNIASRGGRSSNSGQLYYYFSQSREDFSDESKVGQTSFSSIDRNREPLYRFEYTIPGDTEYGLHYLNYLIDATNNTLESDESNNTFGRPIRIVDHRYELGGQNEYTSEIRVTPTFNHSNVQAGHAFDIDLLLENIGPNAMDRDADRRPEAYFFLSRNEGQTGADYQINENRVRTSPLNSGEEATLSFHYQVPWDYQPGNYYLNYQVNLSNDVSRFDNSGSFPITIDPVPEELASQMDFEAPDFVVSEAQISSSTFAQDGGGVASLVVTNMGIYRPESSSVVRFYLTDDPEVTYGQHMVCEKFLDQLNFQVSDTPDCHFDIPIDATPGDYYLVYMVDPDDRAGERNRENNRGYFPITVEENPDLYQGVDLYVGSSSASSTVAAGSPITVNLTVNNRGPDPIDGMVYYYFSDQIDDHSAASNIDSDSFQGVTAGNPSSESFTYTIPESTPPGDYYLNAYVDPNNYIEEDAENNNHHYRSVTVTEPAPEVGDPDSEYDLTYDTHGINVRSVRAGNRVRISVGVKNAGTARLNRGGKVYYYFSQDPYDHSSQYKIAQDGYGRIRAGRKSNEFYNYKIPANTEPGLYFLYYSIDHQDQIIESDESNNQFGFPILVLGSQGAVLNNDVDLAISDFEIRNVSGLEPGHQMLVEGFVSYNGSETITNVPYAIDIHSGGQTYRLTDTIPGVFNLEPDFYGPVSFVGTIPSNVPTGSVFDVEVMVDVTNHANGNPNLMANNRMFTRNQLDLSVVNLPEVETYAPPAMQRAYNTRSRGQDYSIARCTAYAVTAYGGQCSESGYEAGFSPAINYCTPDPWQLQQLAGPWYWCEELPAECSTSNYYIHNYEVNSCMESNQREQDFCEFVVSDTFYNEDYFPYCMTLLDLWHVFDNESDDPIIGFIRGILPEGLREINIDQTLVYSYIKNTPNIAKGVLLATNPVLALNELINPVPGHVYIETSQNLRDSISGMIESMDPALRIAYPHLNLPGIFNSTEFTTGAAEWVYDSTLGFYFAVMSKEVQDGLFYMILYPEDTGVALYEEFRDFIDHSFSSEENFAQASGYISMEVAAFFIPFDDITKASKLRLAGVQNMDGFQNLARIERSLLNANQQNLYLDSILRVDAYLDLADVFPSLAHADTLPVFRTAVDDHFFRGATFDRLVDPQKVSAIISSQVDLTRTSQAFSQMSDLERAATMLLDVDARRAADVLVGIDNSTKTASILRHMPDNSVVSILANVQDTKRIASYLNELRDSRSIAPLIEGLDETKAMLVNKDLSALRHEQSSHLTVRHNVDLGNPSTVEEGLYALEDLAVVAKPQFDHIASNLANEIGVNYRPAPLKTLHSDGSRNVDGTTRALSKLNNDYGGTPQAAQYLTDEVRGTYIYSDVESIYNSLPHLFDSLDTIFHKDRFIVEATRSGYRDINILARLDDGFVGEIQLTTAELLKGKTAETPIYNVSREISHIDPDLPVASLTGDLRDQFQAVLTVENMNSIRQGLLNNGFSTEYADLIIAAYINDYATLTVGFIQEHLDLASKAVYAEAWVKESLNAITPDAANMVNYLRNNQYAPLHNYRGGTRFERRGSMIGLPGSETQLYEFDIYENIDGVDRGLERIVTDKDGNDWYTNDHYRNYYEFE